MVITLLLLSAFSPAELKGTALKITVIRGSTELEADAKALERTLRDAPEVRSIVPHQLFKGLAGLDDQGVSAALTREPARLVDRVLVLRASGVTVFDANGKRIETPPPAKSEDAGDVISRVMGAKDKESHSIAQEEFEKKALIYGETTFVWVNRNGAYAGTVSHVAQGKYQRVLEWPEFYDIVGRQDLKAEYEGRRTLKIALIAIGTPVWIGGLTMATIGSIAAVRQTTGCLGITHVPCSGQPEGPIALAVTGGVLTVSGIVLAMAGAFYRVLKQQPHEIRELVDDYNDRLGKGEVAVAPWFNKDGGGANFQLSF